MDQASQLKAPLSEGNDQKGKAVYVWVEKASSKPPFVNLKLKAPLSEGNDQKGKGVYVWVEKASSAFSSRPTPPPELLPSSSELPQPTLSTASSELPQPTLSTASSHPKRRNRRCRQRNKKSSLEPPLVPVPPPSGSSSSGSSPKLPPNSRPDFSSSAHSHPEKPWIENSYYSWIENSSSSSSPLVPPSGYSSSSGSPSSSPKLPPTLRRVHLRDQPGKTYYSWVEKGSLPIYKIPKNIKALIKNDTVPKVLDQPLSPLTYKNYFAALLYAEEVYLEKWKDYQMVDVTLKLQKAPIIKGKPKKKVVKKLATFMMDSVPERRPFLISRDFVYARPSGRDVQPFEGILYRVEKSSRVLVEFGAEFHYQHLPQRRYDISFSFNRLCFKRAHAAVVQAASSYPPLFQNYLFPPDSVSEKMIISGDSTCTLNDELDEAFAQKKKKKT